MRYLTLLLAALLINACAQAQGCSDAGVCTAGPLGQVAAQGDSTTKALRHFARLQFSYAVGEQGVAISQAVPEISLGITERWSVQARFPFMLISGNLGQNEGVGDPVITSSYAILKRDSLRLEPLIGVKLPANAADARDAGDRPLPMPYQTSLGTTDLLAGISFRSKRLTIALAYQHVLNDGNENGFAHVRWSGGDAGFKYFESWQLRRADDAVARLQCALGPGKWLIQPGLLAILHLGEDEHLTYPDMFNGNVAPFPVRERMAGSDGLTLNITADARYRLNDAWVMEASFGSPVIVREVRPDGLTRSMVLNLGARFSF